MTTHNTHKRHTSTPTAEFEPAVPASDRPHTLALDRSATGFGNYRSYTKEKFLCAQLSAMTLKGTWNGAPPLAIDNSFRTRPLLQGERAPNMQRRGWSVPQSQSECCGEKKMFCSCRESKPDSSVVHHVDRSPYGLSHRGSYCSTCTT